MLKAPSTYILPANEAEQLKAMTLEQLLAVALDLGRINLYQSKEGGRKFHFSITFGTVPGTLVEAKSDFRQPTIEDAIIVAIEKAWEIRAHFKE